MMILMSCMYFHTWSFLKQSYELNFFRRVDMWRTHNNKTVKYKCQFVSFANLNCSVTGATYFQIQQTWSIQKAVEQCCNNGGVGIRFGKCPYPNTEKVLISLPMGPCELELLYHLRNSKMYYFPNDGWQSLLLLYSTSCVTFFSEANCVVRNVENQWGTPSNAQIIKVLSGLHGHINLWYGLMFWPGAHHQQSFLWWASHHIIFHVFLVQDSGSSVGAVWIRRWVVQHHCLVQAQYGIQCHPMIWAIRAVIDAIPLPPKWNPLLVGTLELIANTWKERKRINHF